MKIETNELTIDQLDRVRGAGMLHEVTASSVRFKIVAKLSGTVAPTGLEAGPAGGTGGGSTGGGCPGQPTHH